MSNKYSRYNSVISKTSDEEFNEDIWLNKIKEAIEKSAVQPKYKDQEIFDQINSIMNNKSRYPSVQAAVDDMKERSGLTAYLNKINKISSEEENNEESKKTATAALEEPVKKKIIILVFQKCPSIKKTIENCIKDSKGTLPIPVILSRVQSIHKNDINDEKDWDDDNLLKYISNLNLREKSQYHEQKDFNNLGLRNNIGNEDIMDASNTDAFVSLNPAKI